MTATNQHLTFYAGEDLTITAQVLDGDGDPVSLTGASITWVLVSQSGTAVITKTTAGGTVTLSTTTATNDTVSVTLTDTDTGALTDTVYTHEAAITSDPSQVLWTGGVTVRTSRVLS